MAPTGIALSQQLEKSGCCNQESYVQLIISSAERAELVYMHASATSIEVTALCNVHRFFSSSTQIR